MELYKKFRDKYENNVKLNIEEFQLLVSVIEGRIYGNEIKRTFKKINNGNLFNCMVVAIIEIEKKICEKEILKVNLQQQFTLISRLIYEKENEECRCIKFVYLNKLVIIAGLKNEESLEIFTDIIKSTSNTFYSITNKELSSGIGNVYNDINNIIYSYMEAKKALVYSFFQGNGSSICIKNILVDSREDIEIDEKCKSDLFIAISLSNAKDISVITHELFRKIQDKVLTINKYKIYLGELIGMLFEIIKEYNLKNSDIFHDDFDCYAYLDHFSNIQDMEEWFKERVIKINSIIKRKSINSSRELVEKAKDYINQNYDDSDMSVEKLSSKLHVSQTYFSTIFKKETEMSFVNYLTHIRLEKAMMLLKSSSEKTYIIAKKVGYPEANYFSYVFKKKTGVSPLKYRRNYIDYR